MSYNKALAGNNLSFGIQNLIATMVILVFAAINIGSVLRYFSLTTDEDKHILYGEHIISGDSDRIDDSKMPITGLNLVPRKLASYLDDGPVKYYLNKLYVARAITIFFSCLLAFLVFYWARLLFGFIPALFSLMLYVLDPNIIAHSQLVTTDLYLTAAITFAFFSLWKFANNRNWQTGIICLFALGIAQLTKYTAIVLFPLFFITIIVYESPIWWAALRTHKGIKDSLVKYLKYFVISTVVSVLIINTGFLFNGIFTRFGDYKIRSDLFNNLRVGFPVVNNLPVPIAYPYLSGLDWMINTEQTGDLAGNVYLLGHISTLKGFSGYYFVASLLKVPVSSQIIYLLAIVLYLLQKNVEHLRRNGIFLLVPVVFFTIYFNFFFNTQIGIRYYLPVFPLLYVLAGFLFREWRQFTTIKWLVIVGLYLYLTVSVFSYYPYNLSYMNEILLDRRFGYKYLADSNLNWGQSKNELRQYLSEHPDALVNPNNVRSGHFVIDVNELVGVSEEPTRFEWLRNNFEPANTIAYSYVVYKISEDEIAYLCATTDYCEK